MLIHLCKKRIMNLSITQVPLWISILFSISFSTLPIFLIANAVKTALNKVNNGSSFTIGKKIIVFYWSYFTIIALISLTGFFEKNVLPPRIILFAAIPLFIFYVFYIQKKQWFTLVFKYITVEQLVYINVFRLVGVFFFLCYFYTTLPKQFAFIGGIGDILTAILVFPVVIALRKKVAYAKFLVWAWNIIGLLDIISVLITVTILTKQAIINNTIGVSQFGTFPFSWIPAFAPATIIFIHLLIFKKLREKLREKLSL